MRTMVIGMALACGVGGATAEQLGGSKLYLFTNQMAEMLLAEERCDLAFSPEGVDRYIATKVPADDLAFNERLRRNMDVSRAVDEAPTGAQKAAMCGHAERFARAAGFLVE